MANLCFNGFYFIIVSKVLAKREKSSVRKDLQAIIRRNQKANISFKCFYFIIVSEVLAKREKTSVRKDL